MKNENRFRAKIVISPMKETHPPLIPPSLTKRRGQGVEFVNFGKKSE